MITKPEYFSAWLIRCEEIATALSLPLCFAGIDTATGAAFNIDADFPYLKADIIFGEEIRPYLDGADGQRYNSITQIAATFPKLQQFAALDTAQSVKDLIPLDSVVGGTVYNVAISPVIYDNERVIQVVSATVKIV